MRFAVLTCLLFTFTASAAEVTLNISQPIDGRSVEMVRLAALEQAKSDAADQLPTVIVGVEHHETRNEHSEYTQSIKGLDAGALKLNVISETFDQARNIYSMTVVAELDEKLSLELLRDIQAGQQAITNLKKAYTALDGKAEAAVRSAALTGKNWTLDVPKDLSSAWFSRTTDAESYQAQEKYTRSMLAMLYAKYEKDYLKAIKFTITGERSVKVDLPFEWEGAVVKPLMDSINQKLDKGPSRFSILMPAEPCLVEYRQLKDGRSVVINDISLKKKRDNFSFRQYPNQPYSMEEQLTSLYDEYSAGGTPRNLLDNAPNAMKVKFCYRDPVFYEAVLSARAMIAGSSK